MVKKIDLDTINVLFYKKLHSVIVNCSKEYKDIGVMVNAIVEQPALDDSNSIIATLDRTSKNTILAIYMAAVDLLYEESKQSFKMSADMDNQEQIVKQFCADACLAFSLAAVQVATKQTQPSE